MIRSLRRRFTDVIYLLPVTLVQIKSKYVIEILSVLLRIAAKYPNLSSKNYLLSPTSSRRTYTSSINYLPNFTLDIETMNIRLSRASVRSSEYLLWLVNRITLYCFYDWSILRIVTFITLPINVRRQKFNLHKIFLPIAQRRDQFGDYIRFRFTRSTSTLATWT